MQPVIDFLLPYLRPFEGLLKSRKFWSLLLAVLVSDFGLNLTDNVQAMIYLVAGIVFAGTTAWEDSAVKRGWWVALAELFKFASRVREIADVIGLLLVVPSLVTLAVYKWWVSRG